MLVTPSGVAGLTFADEAATANALVPMLKAQGADTIVLLLHQGGNADRLLGRSGLPRPAKATSCRSSTKLDPAIQLVVSGHTHKAYPCELPDRGRRHAAADQRRQIWVRW